VNKSLEVKPTNTKVGQIFVFTHSPQFVSNDLFSIILFTDRIEENTESIKLLDGTVYNGGFTIYVLNLKASSITKNYEKTVSTVE
jgi:hypothetical protein